MNEADIIYLRGAIERSQEIRMTWFGPRRTNKAESARDVLIAYAPVLLQEVINLRRQSLTPARGEGG